MRLNSSPTCALTGAVARGCIQAVSYAIQRRFAAQKWDMRDGDPLDAARCRAVFVKWVCGSFYST
jgi:hypothetical protein